MAMRQAFLPSMIPQTGLRRGGKSSLAPPGVVPADARFFLPGKHSGSSPADREMYSVEIGSAGWLRAAYFPVAWSPENRSLARPSPRYSLASCNRYRAQVQAPNQSPNGSRRMIFANQPLDIHRAPTHLLSVHVANQRLLAGCIFLAHAASLRQTFYFSKIKFRRSFHSFVTGSARDAISRVGLQKRAFRALFGVAAINHAPNIPKPLLKDAA